MSLERCINENDGKLQSWAWPGGYPIGYLTGEGSVLCPHCANKALSDPNEFDKFKPQSYFIIQHEEDFAYCDGCSKEIGAIEENE